MHLLIPLHKQYLDKCTAVFRVSIWYSLLTFPGQQVHLQWILELVKEVHEQDWSLFKLDFFSLRYWFCKQWRSLALFLPKFFDESGHSGAYWGPRHLVYNLEREYDCFKKHSTSFSSIWIINFIFPTGNFLWIFMKLRAKEILLFGVMRGWTQGSAHELHLAPEVNVLDRCLLRQYLEKILVVVYLGGKLYSWQLLGCCWTPSVSYNMNCRLYSE